MAVFLSAGNLEGVVEKLLGGYSKDTPAVVVYRASWPDQEIVAGTLDDIAGKCAEAGITRQSLVLVGDVLLAREGSGRYEKSKLYDPSFSHGYRAGGNKDGDA
jgi:precorrin-4/cobalt-precorrin-4 C11-methyltransferase